MFGRKRKPEDFAAEIREHVRIESERLQQEQGLSAEEAQAAARRKFGNVTLAEERFYETGRWMWWDQLCQDVRLGLRLLRKNPGFTAVALLTLALGIGANTAIFSVVNAVLFRPLPFKDSGQLADLWRVNPSEGVVQDQMSYPDFLDLRSRNNGFEAMAAFREQHNVTFTGHGEPQHVHGVVASANLFELLGVSPVIGRPFRAEEEQPDKGNVVILSHDFWRTEFQSQSSILGRAIELDGGSYVVIGVMPPGFSFPISAEPVELWRTVDADGGIARERGVATYDVIGRLRHGVGITQATAEVDAIYKRVEQQYPNNHTPGGSLRGLFTLSDLVQNSRDALLVLFAAVGMVLLIACMNVANLILARGATRRREIALRSALGAARLRVIRQLLTENVMLALLGGGLGIAAGYWAITALIRIGPSDIPRLASVSIDGHVLAFAVGVSLLTSLLFGLAPALRISKMELGDVLKERVEGSATSGGSRFREALIVAEVALSLVTVLGAGLLLETLWHLERTNPGFDANHVLAFSLEMPDSFSDVQRTQFMRELLPRLRSMGEVDSASAIFPVPFQSGFGITTHFEIEGRAQEPNQSPRADLAAVDDEYFRAMRIPLIQGQDFAEAKGGPARAVAVVSETFAKQYFPNENPLGKRLKPDAETGHTPAQMAEIVGIVGDVKTSSLREDAAPLVYVPIAQLPINAMTVLIRSQNEPRQLMAAVRGEVQNVNPAVMVFSAKTLEQRIGITLGQPRFNALLLGVFASLALVLAMIGLYGAISYAVSQRTHEIGIRMALGAAPSLVMKAMLSTGLRLAAIGTLLGMGAGLGLSRLMTSLLFGVSATDPLTFLAVATVLLVVAVAACYVPARRAMRVDPMVALRHE
jgi:putative ABC transport system permease protein